MTTISTYLKKQPFEIAGYDKSTLRVMDITQLILMLWTIGSSLTGAGSISAQIITYLLFPFYLYYAYRTRNMLMFKLILFGTSCGLLELFADHYAVVTVDSLVYPNDEPMMWTSPLYMPFAWSNVLLQMSFLSIRLVRWTGLVSASLILSISGGIYVFFYENLARSAGWWFYHNAPMLYNTPYFITGAEMLLFLTLPFMVLWVAGRKPVWSVVMGAIAGVWILVAAIIAYTIAG